MGGPAVHRHSTNHLSLSKWAWKSSSSIWNGLGFVGWTVSLTTLAASCLPNFTWPLAIVAPPSRSITSRPSIMSIPVTSFFSTITQTCRGIFLTMILETVSPQHLTSLPSTALILLAPSQNSATLALTNVVVQLVPTRALAFFPLTVTTICGNKLPGAFPFKKWWQLAQ